MTNGYAPIKAEFLIKEEPVDAEIENESHKGDGAKRQTGMNKNRDFAFIKQTQEYLLCHDTALGQPCARTNCKKGHDVLEYMKTRLPDIGQECPNYRSVQYCKFGVKCRFHLDHSEPILDVDGNLVGYRQKFDTGKVEDDCERMYGESGVGQKAVFEARKKKYKFDRAAAVMKKLDSINNAKNAHNTAKPDAQSSSELPGPSNEAEPKVGIELFEMPSYKKPIDFRGKTYLAPLTTVGNLPFRRLCKDFGVDITCGEMAMADKIIQGNPSDLSLLKRHKSEDLFGVQICGANPHVMTKCAEFLSNEANVDFIDINLGCPIDQIYQKGYGSGALNRIKRLTTSLTGMCQVSTVPITCKIRTGITQTKSIAHDIIPIFKQAGVTMTTLHGRSREQRYTRSANWDYISECGLVAKNCDMQFYGNGDILSFEDYQKALTCNVDGVMFGRPALMKPWIFEECKSSRHWDISAQERFEIMKNFCKYGMEHWGSDSVGVNKTRRFLLEWHSFHCRYIPVGLLEVLPQKINERPARFVGRNDLETLLASPNVNDWVKLSEMILGPVPSNFDFLPKHKSNSYA